MRRAMAAMPLPPQRMRSPLSRTSISSQCRPWLVQRLSEHRVCPVDSVQGPVGEHHPEAERVIGPVALEDGDLGVRVGAAHECREEQPARAAARHRYPHEPASFRTPSRTINI